MKIILQTKIKRQKFSRRFTYASLLSLFMVFSQGPVLCQGSRAGSATGPVRAGKLIKLDHRFAFTEGPVSDKKGNLYFTDQPNNAIWKYTVKGQFSLFMQPAGRANGMYMNGKGNLIVCADLHNQIWRIHPESKKIDILLTEYHHKLLNGPNDLWVDKSGGIYFTDPYYQRSYWSRNGPEQKKACIYYLPKGAKEAKVASDLLIKPNGIVGSMDGKYLYVSDIEGKKIYRFQRSASGQLSQPKILIHHTADGITIDQKGHLYLSGNGVTIVDGEGRILNFIAVNEPWVSNLSFGGKDHNVLFITASTHLYKISTNQKGVLP